MKKLAVTTVLAGSLFAGLFGAAGAANAITAPPATSWNAPQAFDAGRHDAPGYDEDSYYGRDHRHFDDHNPFDLGITAHGPLGGSASIDLGGASAQLPFGMGEAHVGFGH